MPLPVAPRGKARPVTRHPLLQQAAAAGMTLWLEDERLRWRACSPPPPPLLTALREGRAELVEALRPTPAAAALLAFMEAAAAALAEREPDPEEEAERAAIFGRPPPSPLLPFGGTSPQPEDGRPIATIKRPLWESQTMEGRTLALLRTPGVEVVVERDGWLRITAADGWYAFCRRTTAERIGWRS